MATDAPVYHEPKVEVVEYDLPHCQYTTWCTSPRKGKTPFCESCWRSEDSLARFEETYGSKLSLKLPDQVRFVKMRDSSLYSDVELRVDGKTFKGHRVILASSSPYFEKLLETASYYNLDVPDVSENIFTLYLDLLYGKELILNDWRTLMDLCDLTRKTGVDWRMNRVLCKLYVPSEEFLEYIQRLLRLYDGRIPLTLIHQVKCFLRMGSDGEDSATKIDLSSLDPELQEALQRQDDGIGGLRRVTQLYYRNEGMKLYFEVGMAMKKKCVGYYEEERPHDILELTPELRKFCEENDIEL